MRVLHELKAKNKYAGYPASLLTEAINTLAAGQRRGRGLGGRLRRTLPCHGQLAQPELASQLFSLVGPRWHLFPSSPFL